MSLMSLCVADLHRNEIFKGLSEPQLDWLVEHATCVELARGDSLWTAGQPADAMFVVLEGALQMFFDVAGQTRRFNVSSPNGVIGQLPYSRMTEFSGKAFAAEPTRALRIAKETFPAMLHEIPELGYRLVALLSDRVRDATRVTEQREKMMALGKLSAGLAHELNNPAAAVQRAADELANRLKTSNALVARLAQHQLCPEHVQAVVALRETSQPGEGAAGLSTLERSDREDELGEWLEDQGIDDSWVLAEAFVDAGLGLSAVRAACHELPESAVSDSVAWIGSGLAARQLLSQVAISAARISDLVSSIKTYSHMDQNPDPEPADVHRGLDSTLTMLGHKLKRKNLRLERQYDLEIASVPAQVSELNQVWTNLIDNAIDAATEGGEVTIRTEQDGCSIFVRVTDDGSGIDEEHQAKLFDPFFTTKAVGEGTGLGLDIAQRIVIQHEGEITFESQPGKTTFSVRLPLAQALDSL